MFKTVGYFEWLALWARYEKAKTALAQTYNNVIDPEKGSTEVKAFTDRFEQYYSWTEASDEVLYLDEVLKVKASDEVLHLESVENQNLVPKPTEEFRPKAEEEFQFHQETQDDSSCDSFCYWSSEPENEASAVELGYEASEALALKKHLEWDAQMLQNGNTF